MQSEGEKLLEKISLRQKTAAEKLLLERNGVLLNTTPELARAA